MYVLNLNPKKKISLDSASLLRMQKYVIHQNLLILVYRKKVTQQAA